ncbi:CPBP family intramembrane glutamic endopeptidase [Roseibacillus persicicus]|uniref:CPBP family intramembrane glutamic endopeptidase n=1 Tax=Roseibacillus persicicus TaxID=454148 RepID=UPI00398B66D9
MSKNSSPLAWCFLLPALVVPLLGSLLYFVWLPDSAVAQGTYTATKIFTLVYPLFFVGWKELFTARPNSSWAAVFGVGLASGLLIVAAGIGLMMTPVGDMVRAGAKPIQEKAELLGFANHFLLFAIFISLFHSALEEFYWRGFVFGKLRQKLGKAMSHVVAALAFAAHHLVVTWQFFPPVLAIFLAFCVAVGGGIWTILYQKQGSLLGCWISHLCVDVLLMAVGYQLIFS